MIALIVSIVAVLISAYAVFDARRSARRANSAAERSAAAMEQQVELARPPDVDFLIEHVKGALYTLRNTGAKTAHGVSIPEDVTRVSREFPVGVTLEPGEASKPFFADTLPPSVPVTCDEVDGVIHARVI